MKIPLTPFLKIKYKSKISIKRNFIKAYFLILIKKVNLNKINYLN